jgi:hypothetical protein
MHLPEPIYPCYLPVLGEFNRMTPHEGPTNSLPEKGPWPEIRTTRSPAGSAHGSGELSGNPGMSSVSSQPSNLLLCASIEVPGSIS